jgi:hypothetical protein
MPVKLPLLSDSKYFFPKTKISCGVIYFQTARFDRESLGNKESTMDAYCRNGRIDETAKPTTQETNLHN